VGRARQDCISPQEDERIGAHELAHQSTNCFLKVIAQELFDKKVCNNFSIRCRIEYVPRLLQLLSKLTGVNQISIMCYGNSSVLYFTNKGWLFSIHDLPEVGYLTWPMPT